MKNILLALLLLPSLALAHENKAQADNARVWHLLERQANGGIGGIKHGLTHAECLFAYNRIKGLPATPEEVEAENTRISATGLLLDAVYKAHPNCKETQFQEGHVLQTVVHERDDGFCTIETPVDLSASRPNHNRSFGPTDIDDAECFK